MKYAVRALAVLSVLALGACTPGTSRQPSASVPGTERVGFAVEVYDAPERPGAARIPKLSKINVLVDGTDSFGGKGIAGNVLPFDDVAASTPYFYAFDIQTGLAAHLTATVTYLGKAHQLVRCWFEDSSGNELLGSRKEVEVIDVGPNGLGSALVTCEHFTA